MQEIESVPLPAALTRSFHGTALRLVIGDKRKSSWSMRVWVAMKAFDIPFEEIPIQLDQANTTDRITAFSQSGRVPILLDGERTIWDSLAICEYLAEREPDMWPMDAAARAHARSICAEMHSGFAALRSAMSFCLGEDLAGQGRTPAAQADIARISEIWEECLHRYGAHGFLFGEFSIADAYFAPVVLRFVTYGVSLAPALQAYVNRVASHPAVAQWISEALMEPPSKHL